MSLRNVTLYNTGGEEVTLTIPNGATERELVSSPAAVTGGLQLVFADDMNAVVRRSVTFRSKVPAYDAKAKTWSKGRREIAYSVPVEVAPGVYQSRVTRVIQEIPAVSNATDIVIDVDTAIQLAKSPEARQFLIIGTND